MIRTVLVAAALVLAAGCSSGSPSGTPTDRSHTGAPTHSSAPAAPLTPTAPASTPLGAGERVWAAFAQHGLDYRAWWAGLRPLLSDAARAVYVYDDPRNIPTMRLTGPLRVAAKPPGAPRFTSEVLVPTDKGVFKLDLERHSARSPWLLFAIGFPPTVH